MGSSGKNEQDRVRSLLLDTVTLLCKNGLNFKQQMKVQGLLGITLDDDSVFIVHIDEKVGELLPEKKCEESSERSSIDSRRSSRDSQSTPFKNRKRPADSSPVFRGPPNKIKVKTEKDDDYDDEDDEDLIMLEENDDFDDKSRVQAQILQQQQPNFSANIHSGYPSQFNPQNNMQQPAVGGFMPGVAGMPQHGLPPGPGGTPEKRPGPVLYFPAVNLRRSKSAMQKGFPCDHPSCNKNYYENFNLRRHYREKHGGMSFQETKELQHTGSHEQEQSSSDLNVEKLESLRDINLEFFKKTQPSIDASSVGHCSNGDSTIRTYVSNEDSTSILHHLNSTNPETLKEKHVVSAASHVTSNVGVRQSSEQCVNNDNKELEDNLSGV